MFKRVKVKNKKENACIQEIVHYFIYAAFRERAYAGMTANKYEMTLKLPLINLV